jgi:hypothetical protein
MFVLHPKSFSGTPVGSRFFTTQNVYGFRVRIASMRQHCSLNFPENKQKRAGQRRNDFLPHFQLL